MFKIDQRLDFRAPLDILLNKYVGGIPHVCRATDISRGGMLIHRLLEPEMAGHDVGLQFQLPGQDRIITAAGRVVYQHPQLPAMGVQFTNLSERHRRMIERYVLDQIDWIKALGGVRANTNDE
jgi:c-di-GMP-binding flagellar brake protein YcgR